jgi:hypothetical protein
MTYTPKDLSKAWEYTFEDMVNFQTVEDLAQLIADVRREALEEAAVSVERFDEQAVNEQFIASRKHMARRIRALKDGAKDPAQLARIAGAVGFGDGTYMPDVPKCKVCGEGPDHDGHNKHARGPGRISFYHTYRPEVALKDGDK